MSLGMIPNTRIYKCVENEGREKDFTIGKYYEGYIEVAMAPHNYSKHSIIGDNGVCNFDPKMLILIDADDLNRIYGIETESKSSTRTNFTTTIKQSIQDRFKEKCNEKGIGMNVAIEAFMQAYSRGEYEIVEDVTLSLVRKERD